MNNIHGKLEELIHQLTAYEKMYEQTRVVDPVNKKVIYVKDNGVSDSEESSETCYHVWKNGRMCKNCISMRAYNENETFIKIETTPDKIIMLTAIPVKVGGKPVVVELLKNVTRSMILDDVELSEGMEIKKLLKQANAAAVTDELTGVFNKRYIFEKLPVDIALSHLENEPLAVLMADIDLFKNINDTYGHLAGDCLLHDFAEILQKNIRPDKDWVARFGGEEFIVCLVHADMEAAMIVADRMRQDIEEAIFQYKGETMSVTASFGVCVMEIGTLVDDEAMIHCADEKMYEAKRTGRNKVVG